MHTTSEPPRRLCDLVMKGGTSSGVVYPRAVHEIARRFHLVGISGTSAGAIAASLAAAAEYRRRWTGSFDGFEELAELGEELAKKGKLLELFTPDRPTKAYFKDLLKMVDKGWGFQTTLRLMRRLIWRRRRMVERLRENYFGLCTGMANGRWGRKEPLTPWLERKISEISTKEAITGSSEPLTFRDLHEAELPRLPAHLSLGRHRQRSIDFRVVTTCLTFGRPYELPFSDQDDDRFAFDPSEWERIFPKTVLEYLQRKGSQIDRPALKTNGRLPLPDEDLPISVATRFSLSFPILLSMVPLWAKHRKTKEMRKVWFSDGGITSNFPMHRFDSINPRWPTLGITLSGAESMGNAKTEEGKILSPEERVVMNETEKEGTEDRWVGLGETGPNATRDLIRFGISIFRSAQNWHDNSFMKLPGYRDRAVEIQLLKKEGGLNLNMKEGVVKKLVEAGELAGTRIADRFSSERGAPMSWDGHRWTRFQAGMAALTDLLERLHRSVEYGPMVDPPTADWLASDDPPSQRENPPTPADKEFFEALLKVLDEHLKTDERPCPRGPGPHLEYGSRAHL